MRTQQSKIVGHRGSNPEGNSQHYGLISKNKKRVKHLRNLKKNNKAQVSRIKEIIKFREDA